MFKVIILCSFISVVASLGINCRGSFYCHDGSDLQKIKSYMDGLIDTNREYNSGENIVCYRAGEEIINNLFYYGTLATIGIHSFGAFQATKTTSRILQFSRLPNLGLKVLGPIVYFSDIFSTTWVKQRKVIYGFIRCEKVQWVLDFVLSRKAVSTRWKKSTWKVRTFMALIYSAAFWRYSKIIFFCYKIYMLPMLGILIVEFSWDLIYPYRIKYFKFQALPFSIQQRFYELQTPTTKSRISKAHFNPILVPYYNQIHVDKYCIRNGPRCHELLETQNGASKNFAISIILCCSPDKVCTCPKTALKKVTVSKRIMAISLSENIFSTSISMVDYSNISMLYIYHCSLNQQDFEIIPTMNLKYLCLCLKNDNQSFYEKMEEVLNYVIGIPHLRLQYVGNCNNPSDFEILLVRWVIRNGYVKSIVCSANDDFFRSHTVFASCPNIYMYDKTGEELEDEK